MFKDKFNRSVILFILKTAKPFNFYIFGLFVVSIIWAIELSLNPYIIKLVLNTVALVDSHAHIHKLLTLCACYIMLELLIVIASRSYEWIWLKFEPNFEKHIHLTLMEYIVDHSYGFYQEYPSGKLINKINDVVGEVPRVLKIFIDQFFGHILALSIATYTVWNVNVKFAIGLTIWVTFFLTLSLVVSHTSKTLSDNAAEVRSSVVGLAADIFYNISTVRLFNGKKIELGLLTRLINQSVNADQKRDMFFLTINAIQSTSFLAFQGICLWWLILGFKKNVITAGDFGLILALNISIVNCLWSMGKNLQHFSEDYGRINQGLQTFWMPHEIQDKLGAQELSVVRGEIIFRDVYFYHKGKGSFPLFQDLSVTISPKQKVGLVGFSGSGKTTFANLMLRLFDVNGGEILIDGQNIAEVTQDSLRHFIAVIPQDPILFNRSLIENIRYAHINATDQEVTEAAEKAHAHHFIESLPQGYHSLAGERGMMLSGGQRQRIAIARAILKDAPILVLDEATSQLDALTEFQIQESLENLMKYKTTLVIAHRLSTLMHMDRILVFDRGKIVQDGSNDELLSRKGLYRTLWNTQQKGLFSDKKIVSPLPV